MPKIYIVQLKMIFASKMCKTSECKEEGRGKKTSIKTTFR